MFWGPPIKGPLAYSFCQNMRNGRIGTEVFRHETPRSSPLVFAMDEGRKTVPLWFLLGLVILWLLICLNHVHIFLHIHVLSSQTCKTNWNILKMVSKSKPLPMFILNVTSKGMLFYAKVLWIVLLTLFFLKQTLLEGFRQNGAFWSPILHISSPLLLCLRIS